MRRNCYQPPRLETKFGTFHQPGPGFAAFLTGLFVAGIGLAIALSGAFSKSAPASGFDPTSAFKNISWSRIVYTMALLVAYALFLDMLGYIVTTFLVMFGLFLRQGNKPLAFKLSCTLWELPPSVTSCLTRGSIASSLEASSHGGEGTVNYFHDFMYGLGIAFQPWNLLACFFGVFIGTLIGVLPGIGPVGTMSLLLPITFGISPVTGIIMLAGIFYGSQYGGSTTSILVNIPGEATSVVTCIDGYQMACQGRAGPALGIAAFGSFIAGTLSVVGLMFLANPLAEIAVSFGFAEYFSLMCLGLSLLIYMTQGSILRGLIMAGIGLLSEFYRPGYYHGSGPLHLRIEGIGGWNWACPFGHGAFWGFRNPSQSGKPGDRIILESKIKGLLPNREDWRRSAKPIARGTLLGFFLGILPGAGGVTATFVSYALEKKFSQHPERFGKGAIEGVAGPEAANNAATGASLVPLFSLGIPF